MGIRWFIENTMMANMHMPPIVPPNPHPMIFDDSGVYNHMVPFLSRSNVVVNRIKRGNIILSEGIDELHNTLAPIPAPTGNVRVADPYLYIVSTPIPQPQQAAEAKYGVATEPIAHKTLTEQVSHNHAWRKVIRRSLREACNSGDSLLNELDSKVGEYFSKERTSGRILKLSDIQEMIAKTARELKEQKAKDAQQDLGKDVRSLAGV